MLCVDDGMVVDLVDGKISVAGKVACGYVYVDGLNVGDVSEEQLKDRRILGDEGFITITVVVDSTTGKVIAGPEIFARGFSALTEEAFAEVRLRASQALDSAMSEGVCRSRRVAARAASRGRALGFRHLPSSPDAGAGDRRGLTQLAGRDGFASSEVLCG